MMWGQYAAQMLGMAAGQPQQGVLGQAGYNPYSSGYYNPIGYGAGFGNITTTENTALHIGDADSPEKVEEPSEFEQLSNHKFHELLAKFAETR